MRVIVTLNADETQTSDERQYLADHPARCLSPSLIAGKPLGVASEDSGTYSVSWMRWGPYHAQRGGNTPLQRTTRSGRDSSTSEHVESRAMEPGGAIRLQHTLVDSHTRFASVCSAPDTRGIALDAMEYFCVCAWLQTLQDHNLLFEIDVCQIAFPRAWSF
ncbi:hypothetical protein F442_16090 [Phytophthora nicotianae P10297]|uniref:Uncharacterized protein n=1 Tax=Phytophthora nicotianae P10297 TaxID=1317064 RepID=W2YNT4_PHYNI|nr:hypothetical protein F442_16090 [Phytophthora nicotianae P10297]